MAGSRTKCKEAEAEPSEEAFVDDEQEEDIEAEDGPPTIDPYEILGLDTAASADDVKKKYRKLALKHHPDKAPADAKDAANKKFQEIAFAYAVLSDDRRRKRYDLTGNTAETIEDDDDFNWLNFYREQFEDVVNEEAISKLSSEYKGGAEERQDLLNAYTKTKGNLNAVYELVMLSDILEDDDRFREILDEEIEQGNIESYPTYARETDKTRQKAKDFEKKRREDYDKRQAKVEKAEQGNGAAKSKPKAKGKKSGGGDMADLAALIQQRQKARAGGFFDQLEAKYAPKSRGSKRSTPIEEPPEGMFQANRAKKVKPNGRVRKPQEEDEDMDLGEEDIGDSDNDDEEDVRPKSKVQRKGKGQARGRAKA